MSSKPEISAIAPGNMLVAGEYIILEEGGRGIAMACGPQAHGRAWPSSSPWSVIHAITGEGAISLNTATTINDPPFIIRVYRSVLEQLNLAGLTPPALEIEINTSGFFSQGRKLGFGSSAAATVLLAGLVTAWCNESGALERESLAAMAVKAHRHAQGKKGSGYDILTSCFGSAGVFTGGDHPTWIPLREDHPMLYTHSYSFPGPKEVDSRQAVLHYNEWKKVNGSQSTAYIARSQDLVEKLRLSHDEEEFMRYLTELRILSTELGEHIGVESWISPPSAFYERSAWKGSGAGNELGLLFLSRNSGKHPGAPYQSLSISPEGLRLFDSQGLAIL